MSKIAARKTTFRDKNNDKGNYGERRKREIEKRKFYRKKLTL